MRLSRKKFNAYKKILYEEAAMYGYKVSIRKGKEKDDRGGYCCDRNKLIVVYKNEGKKIYSYAVILLLLAHEVRHAYQFYNKKYCISFVPGRKCSLTQIKIASKSEKDADRYALRFLDKNNIDIPHQWPTTKVLA